MKSIQIEKFGGPEVLVTKDIDIGKPGPKEVLQAVQDYHNGTFVK